jgi:hypothetical protein
VTAAALGSCPSFGLDPSNVETLGPTTRDLICYLSRQNFILEHKFDIIKGKYAANSNFTPMGRPVLVHCDRWFETHSRH